jgi:hypothetical protein
MRIEKGKRHQEEGQAHRDIEEEKLRKERQVTQSERSKVRDMPVYTAANDTEYTGTI